MLQINKRYTLSLLTFTFGAIVLNVLAPYRAYARISQSVLKPSDQHIITVRSTFVNNKKYNGWPLEPLKISDPIQNEYSFN